MTVDPTRAEVSEMVQRALKQSGVVLRTLADDSAVSYGTLRQWAVGHRSPSDENVRRIVAGLRSRAAKLEALAAELDGAAGE